MAKTKGMKKLFNRRIRKLKDYRIHREGTEILIVAFLLFLLVNAPLWYFFHSMFWLNTLVGISSLVIYLLMVNFFRSPKRIFFAFICLFFGFFVV